MVSVLAGGAYVLGLAVAIGNGTSLVIYVPYATVGTLLVIRRPRNLIAWILCAIAWSFVLSWLPVVATADELLTATAPVLPLVGAWFNASSFPFVLALFGVLAVLFPTGRLSPGRWRSLGRATVVAIVVLATAAAFWPTLQVLPQGALESVRFRNPIGLLPEGIVGVEPAYLTGPALFAILAGSIVAMVVRHSRAAGPERLQLRWLIASLAAIAVAIPTGFVLFAVVGPEIGGVAWVPAILAFTLPPVAVGIAVTRYRLYEIDRVISRTIGWAVVTGVLVAVFAGLVVGLQALLASVTQGQTLAVAASTLAAFALFQPVRRRVQHAVDHRFDRARYDGERTAAAFAERLRQEVDLSRVSLELVAAAQATVRPEAATVWLRGGRT